MKSDDRIEEGKCRGSELIGSISFMINDAALDARLEKAPEWWNGIHRPEGVELGEAERCQYALSPLTVQLLVGVFACGSCKFSTGRGWPEKKSNGSR